MFITRRAFTLIELLVVIAIIAILSIVVVLTLNPAQLLMQSRDGDRLSDLSTLNSALGDYTADQGGAGNFSMGSSSVTYVSVPDPTATTTAGTDCTGIGFPTGGSFHCAASSTYRAVNGTGWIPINLTAMSGGAPIAQLPTDPVNQTSTNLYYTYQTDGTTFKIRAVPESQSYLAQAATNPNVFTSGNNLALGGGTGWVLVPGNSTFGTSNFWVMKYDAVCSNGEGTYENPTAENTSYNTYSNTTLTCTPSHGFQIASLPSGWPIANISQTTAASYCNSIGASLITNNQWQTIAWNAEQVASNWSGGTVGSGHVFSGHNDNAPATALVADPNDGNGYAGETNVGGTQKRTLALNNGSIIWDMAGNIWQWTNDTIIGTNEPGVGAFNWNQFTALTTYGTMTQATVGPANSAWNSTQGMGEIYSEGGQTDPTTYGFLRGGFWNNGADDGVETLSLSNGPASTNYSFGFRCAR